MLVSEYVAEFIANQKVKHAFVITGGASIHLLHALHHHPEVEPVCTHHEQGAAMAADGYARANGNLGVAVATSGPGATNLITGIAGAWFDSVPTLFISGQVTTFRLKGATGVRQFGFQETEVLPMVKPITKYCVQIRDAQNIRYELEKACSIARSGRPGPVLVDIPDDLQRTEIDPETLGGYTAFDAVADLTPSAMQLQQLTQLLDRAERPVLILGWGIRLAGGCDQAISLAEKWGIPVLTSWAAKDMIDAAHSLCVGTFGTHGTRTGNFTVQNADLVISIGARLSTRETGSPLSSWARGAKKVIIDIDESELGKFSKFDCPLELPIHSDAKNAINAFAQNIEAPSGRWHDWLATISGWAVKYPVLDFDREADHGLNPYLLMSVLSGITPSNALIYSDTGCSIAWLMQGFRQKLGQRIYHDFNNTAMGWGLPAAIGGAFASPDKPVICVAGDGSFMMNLQELSTLVHHRLNLKVILIDNGGYSMVRQTEEQWLDGVNIGTSVESGLSFPDFRKVSDGFGLTYLCVESNDELPEKLSELLAADGPALLQVMVPHGQRVVPQVTYGYPLEDSEPHLPRAEFAANMIVTPMPRSLEPTDPTRTLHSEDPT
jgi:acetolactate synthase-1/2/3 large subunit